MSGGPVRVAAIDCGTNSLRLLVADVDPAADRLVDVHRLTRIVRLGEGVDATGELAPAAVRRALAVTAEYAELCRRAGATRIRFVATSAARDARNAGAFAAQVRSLLGVEPEVLPGEEEARLSFAGATRGVPSLSGGSPAGAGAAPCLVVDLGGGSTELVLGDPGTGTVEAAVSLDVGSVRMTERYLHGDPPSPAEVAAARADVAARLDGVAARLDGGAAVDLGRARSLVGVAGTVTTITAHALGLPGYDRARVDGAVLDVRAVRAACADLIGRSRADRARLPYLEPGRVDVIGAGALVWDLVVARVAARSGLATVVTSERDILDGVTWGLAVP